MDPNSSYFLEIKFIPNARSRKDVSCYVVEMVRDSDATNFKDFVDDILEKYRPRYHERISVEYPLLNSSETAPPPPSQPTGKRKRDEKAAAVKGKIKKTKGAATKKTKGAATTKKKLSLLPVTPQSPAMCTRSKTPESPAMSTRSKRKILD
ncbi:unnamed protein product [Urochloa humidicola]